jgi:hypothetical protein
MQWRIINSNVNGVIIKSTAKMKWQYGQRIIENENNMSAKWRLASISMALMAKSNINIEIMEMAK